MKRISFKKGLINAFYNLKWRCNACDEEIFNGKYFCDSCEKSLPYIKENKCYHCGRNTAYAMEYCDSCIEKNVNFTKARSVFSYKAPINILIQNLKYENKLYLSNIFCDYFIETYLSNFSDTDFITFVPSTKKSLRERGYNQSEVMADKLSKKVGVPVVSTAIKVKDTMHQVGLNAEERRKNLKGVFKLEKVDLKGKNLLIIDDVLTTGTTADVLAELYKKHGANKVYVLTIASVSKV